MATILVVDDDPIIIELLTGFLRGQGHTVLSAMDGLNVPQIIHQSKPDLIFLDYQMPGGTGAAILERIRAICSSINTPVIVLSAAPLYEIKANIREGPLVRIMFKPIDFALVTRTIAELLGPALTPRGVRPPAQQIQSSPSVPKYDPDDQDPASGGRTIIDLDADP